MLVVMIFGSAPMKTNLVFSSLDECLRAEDSMRAAYASAYNTWRKWAGANRPDPSSDEPGMQQRIGLRNQGTCIPHAASVPEPR
jgi:hypothetical protein